MDDPYQILIYKTMPHGKTRTMYTSTNTMYTCYLCNKTYNSKYSRDLHDRVVHGGGGKEKETTICIDCRKPISRARWGHEGYCKCRR